MTDWIVAGLAWIIAALALPPVRRHVPQSIVQVVHAAALFGFLLMGWRWWYSGFTPEAWNDRAFAVMMLGLAADGCIRARVRQQGGPSSAT